MKTFLIGILAVAASLPLMCNADDNSRRGILEFRLAVSEPAEGYTKHDVVGSDKVVYVSGKTVVTGRDIEKVSFYDDANGEPAIGFVFAEDGSKRFWKATSENAGKQLAILIDGKVISAPNILQGIRKECAMTGRFDDDTLQRIFTAVVLRRAPIATNPKRGE